MAIGSNTGFWEISEMLICVGSAWGKQKVRKWTGGERIHGDKCQLEEGPDSIKWLLISKGEMLEMAGRQLQEFWKWTKFWALLLLKLTPNSSH